MAELKNARTVALSGKAPNGIALYQAGECLRSATYPQYRATDKHKCRFIPIDNPILPVVAWPAVSIHDQILHGFLTFAAGSTFQRG
jgi:hypothetical protein